MLDVRDICSIRYCDIEEPRDSPLITMNTFLANFDKYMAACPAEFPPPTT
jgi:hypothetical protein